MSAKNATSVVTVLKNDTLNTKQKMRLIKLRMEHFFLGFNDRKGFLMQLVIYLLLLGIGFVYLYPILYMFVTSMKSLSDLLDSAINWIPSSLYLSNYKQAYEVLNVRPALLGSLQIALFPTLLQVAVASLVGYGFARFEFPLKKFWFALMIISFIIPPQITMMPTYRLFSTLGLTGSLLAFIVPASLGQGLNSTIFILIFYQFFKQTPRSLYEAAEVDGASQFTNFFKIAIPMAVPAFIVSFLFSFVWYWNETYLTSLYLTSSSTDITTILLQLQSFSQNYETLYPATEAGPNKINEGIKMAGTMVSILPLLITYFFLQRYFVESVDNTGITGE
ncbi:ABC transporter permease [Halolactibacillus alkaliphilus]|uniref:ABC transporter permease n=1 Tax=Halolactibacillus alkaliphilus TaxID=442899 RepID=A0A511X1D7_9BACI|nr:carbohydrate ABC transporter permease [Halolactibacillus alkaliphilus]GEN56741.1 ABC transporter permease [Halolactibacillus alkaliphilus]GGN70876.1 ABC transporter permease [Halolactibacillus alkaliphilus]SFO80003.1 multiple sugar transport system permease protein [Halolactibacillus alkaliphilus]